STAGDIWRWDGFTAAAEAPNAAAKRLAERNRLAALDIEMTEAGKAAEAARALFEAARDRVESAAQTEREKRESLRSATSAVEAARQALVLHERAMASHLAQTSAVDEALRRIEQSLAEARGQLAGAEAEAASLPGLEALQAELGELRQHVNRDRTLYAEARGDHDGLEREANARLERGKTIETERRQWGERGTRAKAQIEQLGERAKEARALLLELAELPRQIAEKRFRLMDMLGVAETERKAAADALAAAENEVRAADQELRAAQEQLSLAREEHARLSTRLEASRQRHDQCEHRIGEVLQCAPDEVVTAYGIDIAKIPPPDEIERRLLTLREDRERLGAVNLRADEEAAEVARQLDTLIRERDDLMGAINKLRGAISSLNREGRQRLLDAFGTVNEKFGELFTTLFDGGRAELQLIESDDPLEAGLEIIANPPGKKPTVLSLLSGGEQTLTALSLIFAVFLTNPSPICVLDEVDAPLDDHNVECFCNLLDAMLERTDTRFMVITHHPLTMARMNRLYGVTMMERGVSQLVSVNLQEAEAFAVAS
ncbi:MAG: chromosome segregation protein SMC, partial [Aestuariivirga sp.]